MRAPLNEGALYHIHKLLSASGIIPGDSEMVIFVENHELDT